MSHDEGLIWGEKEEQPDAVEPGDDLGLGRHRRFDP
jgi:hypothetical protein